MKKKLVTVLLASSMVATMLAGCGSGSGDGTEKGSSAKGGDGSVYMLNFKPETDQAWQDLAEKYTEVTVVTAADGQYKTTLKSELAKKEAPTIFNIGSTSDCAEYDKYIYDLKDSEIYKHLTDKSLALEYNGKIASVANCYECYGIIYNKAILEKYCSNYSGAVIKSVDDIKDLDTLEKVATDINEHVDDINKACDLHLTEAFASAGLDSGSNWRFTGHLAGLASILHVSSGSSASTVPIPAIMALYLWRRFCTCSLAFSPVIHFDSPEYVAIFPSIVMAYFIATYGRLVCIK